MIVRDYISPTLGAIAQALDDPTPWMRETAGILRFAVDENFREQGRPGGWAPLAAATIRQRKQANPTILQDTGRLVRSFTGDYDREGAQVGTNDQRAPRLQFGDAAANLPARDMFYLSEAELDDIEAAGLRHLGFDALG
jgi:phage gpG-like protein